MIIIGIGVDCLVLGNNRGRECQRYYRKAKEMSYFSTEKKLTL